MTHEQPTPASVEVTPADREAYLALNMLPEKYAADVRGGRWDEVTGMQVLARHRIAHSAPAGEVEPVAWMYTSPDGRQGLHLYRQAEAFALADGWTETPLYTHPAPPADVGELVEAAWRAGFQTARDCLPDDAADVLTEDVEHDQWLDSDTRAAIKHGDAA